MSDFHHCPYCQSNRAAPGPDGWLTCPDCHFRFSSKTIGAMVVQNAAGKPLVLPVEKIEVDAQAGEPIRMSGQGSLPLAQAPLLHDLAATVAASQSHGLLLLKPPSPTMGKPSVKSQDSLPILPTLISAQDLARIVDQPKNRVETWLRRYRKTHPHCFETVDNRRRNETFFLYRSVDFWPDFERKLKEWNRKLTDG